MARTTEGKVHAPYNFVPLSAKVCEHPDAKAISRDVPFSDGISGVLEVELEASTPLCVGGHKKEDTVSPYKTIDGKYAIPGTSIKGMLRNVLEIATFSKFQFVDRDRRYAVRDLQNRDLYTDRMTKTEPKGHGQKVYVSRTKAGWLKRDGDSWKITPCELSRVEQGDLCMYLGQSNGPGSLHSCFVGRSNTSEKYQAWRKSKKPLELYFEAGNETTHPMSAGGSLRFSKASKLGAGSTSGTVVMTGQPSPNKILKGNKVAGKSSGKHREFVFHSSSESSIVLDKDVVKNFQLNHSNSQGEQHGGLEDANAEWKFWLQEMNAGSRVPVFYLGEGETIRSFGLTQMYRLAYENSLGEAIDNTSIDHDPTPGMAPVMDWADGMFGYIRTKESGSVSARGRIDMGRFQALNDPKLVGPFKDILNSPKATYYPSYIDQSRKLGGGRTTLASNQRYATLMDTDVELRGWKRYPVRIKAESPNRKVEGNVGVKWRALDLGTRFTGRIRIHNLRPYELGALLWAIDFGGNAKLRHSLGFAKPFGFGSVFLTLQKAKLRTVVGSEVDLDAARKAFATVISEEVEGWVESEQLVQLAAMANPAMASGADLSYMVLDSKGNRNDFTAAKGKRGENQDVLPSYVPFSGKSDRDTFGRESANDQRTKREKVAQDESAARAQAMEADRLAKKRKETDTAGRVELDYGDWRERSKDEVAELLDGGHPWAVPDEEIASPEKWVSALAEIASEGLDELERRIQDGTDPVGAVDAKIAEHMTKKPANMKKGGKPWTKKLSKLEKDREKAKKNAGKGQEKAEQYREILKFFRGDSGELVS